jgi:N-acylglucosamine 2-epimerase
MHLDRLPQLKKLYADSLRDDIIPFWEKYSPDHSAGGYFTCLARDGSVYDTDKFVWLQARQVWMFSKFFNTLEARDSFFEMAKLGADFLADHGRDARGDWYFALDRGGNPLVQPYNIFSDCFAAMAFAEYGRASGLQWAADLAAHTFERIQQRKDNPKGIYNKTIPGTRPLRSLSLPMITINLALELGSAIPAYPVEQVVRENLTLVMEQFVDRQEGLIFENIVPNGSHPDTFDGRLINPGHGIESMWFVMAAAERTGDRAMIDLAADALEDQMAFGWDQDCGGFFYFRDARNKPLQQLEWDQKLWWVHAEALVATLMGYRITRRPSLKDWYERVHDYTWSHFPDPRHGEWFGYLNRQGEVSLPLKGGKWKGCFHIPRALLLCMREIEKMV